MTAQTEPEESALTVGIVIPTKDRPEDLARCIESVLWQTPSADEVVVVDASQRIDIAPILALLDRGVPIRHIRTRPGLPMQRNVGAEASTSDIVVFLDDDVVLDRCFLAGLLAVFRADAAGTIGGACGSLCPPPRAPQLRRLLRRFFLLPCDDGDGRMLSSGFPTFLRVPSRETDVEVFRGCNMAFRRHVFLAFRSDERISSHGGEDVELSFRVSRQWRLVQTPAARYEHRVTPVARTSARRLFWGHVADTHRWFVREVLPVRGSWKAYLWSRIGLFLAALLESVRTCRLDPVVGFGEGVRDVVLSGWSHDPPAA